MKKLRRTGSNVSRILYFHSDNHEKFRQLYQFQWFQTIFESLWNSKMAFLVNRSVKKEAVGVAFCKKCAY